MWIFVLAALAVFALAALKGVKTGTVWQVFSEAKADSKPQDENALTAVADEVRMELVTISDDREVPSKDIWADSDYCWVVVCKNDAFHRNPNVYNVHRIPLGVTDAVIPRPSIPRPFVARCDECQQENLYDPGDVLRYEMEVPAPFVPHPLFHE